MVINILTLSYKLRVPDVVIFVAKMNDSKFEREDMDTMRSTTVAFGWKMWNRAIFLLTFANIVEPGGVRNEICERTKQEIRNALEKIHVVGSIQVLPVGLVEQPYIHSDSCKEVSWVDEFWDHIFAILKRSKRQFGIETKKHSHTEKHYHTEL